MKSITPIVAIVVLILMTVAAAGMAYLTIVSYQSQSQAGTQAGLETLTKSSKTQIKIESVSGGKIYLRNLGTETFEGPRFYVGGRPIEVSGPDECGAGKVCVFTVVGEVTCQGTCELSMGEDMPIGTKVKVNEADITPACTPNSFSTKYPPITFIEYYVEAKDPLRGAHEFQVDDGIVSKVSILVRNETYPGKIKIYIVQTNVTTFDVSTLTQPNGTVEVEDMTGGWYPISTNVPVSAGYIWVILNVENYTSQSVFLGVNNTDGIVYYCDNIYVPCSGGMFPITSTLGMKVEFANCIGCGNTIYDPGETEDNCPEDLPLTCDLGWGDCDSNYLNGCETHLTSSRTHCGSCGHGCTSYEECFNSTCRTALRLEASTEWSRPNYAGVPYVHVADVDADGFEEILTVDGYDSVYTRLQIWNKTDNQIHLENSTEWTGIGDYARANWISTGDLDGDGTIEILTYGEVVYSSSIYAQIKIWNRTGGTINLENETYWQEESSHTAGLFGSIGDVDADGTSEIVCVSNYGYSNYLNVWNYTDSILYLENKTYIGSMTLRSGFIEDLDGDGANETVLGSNFDINSQIDVWNKTGPNLFLENTTTWTIGDGAYLSKIHVGDADADGAMELLVPGNWPSSTTGPFLRIYNQTGGLLNSEASIEDLWVPSAVMPSVTVLDSDGDSHNETFLGGYEFDRIILKVYDYSQPTLIERAATYGNKSTSDGFGSLAYGDVDNDGTVEIVGFGKLDTDRSYLTIWNYTTS